MTEAPEPDGLRKSPLHDRHVALGAKLAPFGGWQMPLEYGGGVLKEHAAVRERVGVFDVSHLGKVSVTGPGAADFVNGCLTNDLGKIGPGQAQYTLCCDESGGIVDYACRRKEAAFREKRYRRPRPASAWRQDGSPAGRIDRFE